MKKLLLALIFSLFLISTAFARYYEYVGRNVEILLTDGQRLHGLVENVIETEICRQRDVMGTCISWDNFETIYLRSEEKGLVVINEDNIIMIRRMRERRER